jgi:hypothetical protein
MQLFHAVMTFLINASSRNAIRKIYGSNWGCCYFLFEEMNLKCSVQCHLFVQSPPGRHPIYKYPVNTSHRSNLCKNDLLAVLFGNNGN